MELGRILRQKYVYAAWFALHFLLIFSFSCRETLLLVAQGPTIFPASFKNFSKKAETVLSFALGQRLPGSNAIRQAVETYRHLAGIETGYGYFAPSVPGSYKLVFELHYPDGRVEYELPSVGSAAAGLRIASGTGHDRSHPPRRPPGISGENAGPIHLARASGSENGSRRVGVDPFAHRE